MVEVEKTTDVDPKVIARSVQELPPDGAGPGYRTGALPFFYVAQLADEIEPWGRNIKERDRQLRELFPKESMLQSALGIVCARNAAFSWKIEGGERSAARHQKILNQANFGKGWAHFVAQISLDLYTQDSGAYFEIIREADSPGSPVIGIAHLDPSRCYPTGIPDEPVWYQDLHGRFHKMKWYQVVNLLELPATYEGLPDVQYCAVTRMLTQCQIMRDISTYLHEKIGGRNPRAVTLLRGVKAEDMMAALATAELINDSKGRMRYTNPVFVSSVDPNADVDFNTLELASIPDGFDLDLSNKQYILQLAMAFMTDYQEFAPLPGGNLGTSQQSEILHQKSRGKGPGLFQKIVSEAINFLVLPEADEFVWDEQDIQEDKTVAEVRKLRAEERQIRIASGELSPRVARQLALEAGDLTQEQFDALEVEEEEAALLEQQAQEQALAEGATLQTNAQVDEEGEAESQVDTNGSNIAEEAKDFVETLKRFNEGNWIRNSRGQFAGYRGGGGGGAAILDPETIPPSSGFEVDENGDPISSPIAVAEAKRVRARALEVEAKISQDMETIAGELDAQLAGFEHRVKGEGSLARKIEKDAVEQSISYRQSADEIGDSIRFTAIYPPDTYTERSLDTLNKLEERGYEVTKFKNYWASGDGSYRGVNTNLTHRETGLTIELQFHTGESFHVKDVLNHPLYEEARKLTTPQWRRDELIETQRANWAPVTIPSGIQNARR